MAPFRLGSIFAAVLAADLVIFSILPSLRWLLDPFLLILFFIGLRMPSIRFLWAWGLALGFLRDAAGAGLFGTWTCVFALIGWILARVRHAMELEEPLTVSVCVGVGTLAAQLLHLALLALADPSVGWGQMPWGFLPLAALAHAGLGWWGFPRLERLARPSRSCGYASWND